MPGNVADKCRKLRLKCRLLRSRLAVSRAGSYRWERAVADYVVEFGKDGRRVEPDGRLDAPAFHRNHQPLRIDLADVRWPGVMRAEGGPQELLALFCANVIHIAPWRVAEGLFAGAGEVLRADGHLFLYGPFKRDGKHTALSNAVFDTSLRDGNPEWGVRDIADIEQLAAR